MLATRTHWRTLIATIVLLMASAFLVPRFVRAPDIQENRVLAHRPAWRLGPEGLGTLRDATDAYVADRFPIRPYLIGLLNRLRMVAGVSGSPRVIVGRDGWLFFDDGTHMGAARNDPPMTGPQVRSWLMTLAGRTEAAQAAGARYLLVTPPVKETIYPQHGPAWYQGPDPRRPAITLPALATQGGAGEVLYLYPTVAGATRLGQHTYSRHDTHWTGYGAYAGYVGVIRKLQAMGLTDGPRPLSDFDLIKGHMAQRPRDLALMLGVASFVDVDFPHFDNLRGEARLKVTYLGPKQDWTAPQVVDTGEVGKPVLLLTRDSFSNELLPFLLPHFSRIVLAHNQDGFWRPDLIARFKPDIVMLEVLEGGLRVASGDGPAPSAAAVARIDKLLGDTPGLATGQAGQVPIMPTLKAPDRAALAVIAAARPTANCNLEVFTLTRDGDHAASVTISGWISELSSKITSPEGMIRLSGLAGPLTTTVRVDGSRPDVAAYFKLPNGRLSGFLGTYHLSGLPAGAYSATVYRRSAQGWISCQGKQTAVAP